MYLKSSLELGMIVGPSRIAAAGKMEPGRIVVGKAAPGTIVVGKAEPGKSAAFVGRTEVGKIVVGAGS
jgi:hypothetical protein